MVINDFAGKKIFLDTAPLIYFIEGNSVHQQILTKLFEMNDKGAFVFITSTITLLEVLVKPLQEGQTKIAKKYKEILTQATGIELLETTSAIAEQAAQLRAKYKLKTPDSIQLATSLQNDADFFLTNDTRLKVVTEVNSIIVSELI